MYRCQACKKCPGPRVSMRRVVVQTRAVEYPFRKNANGEGRDDNGGRGVEAVAELELCPACESALVKARLVSVEAQHGS